MRRTVLVGIGAALAIALAGRRAEACGQAGTAYGNLALALGAGAILIGGADVALSLYDLSSIGAGPRSAAYGVVEVVFTVPQLALGIAAMSSNSLNASGFFTGYTIWMAALAVHGIWTVAAAPRATPAWEPSGTDPPPAVQETPQLQLGIGPTYAPVGQLAHPGFGVIGRF